MSKTVYERFLQSLYHPEPVRDLRELVLRSARLYGKRRAFVLKNGEGALYEVSYDRLLADCRALTEALAARGLTGCRIAVTGANSYEWALAYLAAVIVGVVVPIDKELCGEDIRLFLDEADCKAVIGDIKTLAKLDGDALEGRLVVKMKSDDETVSIARLIREGNERREKGADAFGTLEIDPDALRVLLFTSGTTGSAKGVCLSQGNICANIVSVSGMVKIRPNEHVLSVLPLHHTYECTLDFLTILYSGACISYADSLRYVYKNISEYHPSILVAVPLLLEKIVNKLEDSIRGGLPEYYKSRTAALSLTETVRALPAPLRLLVRRKVKNAFGGRLSKIIVGAAPIAPDTVDCLCALGIRTMQGYGLTECAPLVAGNNDFFLKSDAVGLPIPGVEIRIDDPDEEGVGEITVRGPNVMLGYYNDAAATDAVLRGGWFYTGDLGRFDDEGWLYITGRKKNVIITKNGKNIYPEELEYRLNANGVIDESLVMGALEGADVTVRAKIFPDLDAIRDSLHGSVPTKEQIAEAVRRAVAEINEKLPSYKRIRSYKIRESAFEKTTTQKIKRFGDNMKDE